MNAALAIIAAFVVLAIGLALRARRGHDMDLEGWSVGGRGFGTIFIFLLMAGEIYSTFTFLGGAGFVYGSAQPYVPPDLEELGIARCKKILRDSETLRSETLGSWSREYDTQKEEQRIADILGRYTRFAFWHALPARMHEDGGHLPLAVPW